MARNYCCVTDFAYAANFFCTFRYIVRQRLYVIYDAIIYRKRPLLRLRLLPSNNELSVVKAHYSYNFNFFMVFGTLPVRAPWPLGIERI